MENATKARFLKVQFLSESEYGKPGAERRKGNGPGVVRVILFPVNKIRVRDIISLFCKLFVEATSGHERRCRFQRCSGARGLLFLFQILAESRCVRRGRQVARWYHVASALVRIRQKMTAGEIIDDLANGRIPD
jgi:hypothetical protein